MKLYLDRFYAFLDRPLSPRGRAVLALMAVPLILSFFSPLWNIHMLAPQYPEGLDLYIYSYKVDGGRDGADVAEINTLNHYIGMQPITRAELVDLDWLPFALGVLVLLVLRCAALGNVRTLVDLAVLSVYIFGFALFRFVYTLYRFGHDLDPHAPFDVEPFTPVILGTKQIANFTTSSWPQLGSVWVGVALTGILLVTAWHLLTGRRAAVREG